MSNFRGIWIALVTPMRDGNRFAGLEKLVKHLLEGRGRFCGVRYYGCGAVQARATGGDAVLGWVEPGRVVMGLSGSTWMNWLAFQAHSSGRWAGCWFPHRAISALRAGIEAFFRTVADAARVPVIVYDIPLPYRRTHRGNPAALRHGRDCSGDLETTWR